MATSTVATFHPLVLLCAGPCLAVWGAAAGTHRCDRDADPGRNPAKEVGVTPQPGATQGEAGALRKEVGAGGLHSLLIRGISTCKMEQHRGRGVAWRQEG